jgi:hypothetical protein
MKTRVVRLSIAGAAALGLVACAGMQSSTGPMSFFITSVGSGNGADLGGLAGADRHCQSLAQAAGAGGKTWRAYLSTQATGGLADANAIHARDRIGSGPWYNAKGVMIARNVEDLHSPSANVNKETALDERGRMVNGRTEKPNKHDILTGSRPDGTAFPPMPPYGDMTCGNWTRSGAEGAVMVGHHDRAGPVAHAWATSWNSAHPSRGGCTQKALQGTGGDGLFYCFAVN